MRDSDFGEDEIRDRRESTRETEVQVTWTWPATIAFLGLLAFIAFVLWLIFA